MFLFLLLHNLKWLCFFQIKIELLVPKKDCDIKTVSVGPLTESFNVFINKRPVRDKKIEKVSMNYKLSSFQIKNFLNFSYVHVLELKE